MILEVDATHISITIKEKSYLKELVYFSIEFSYDGDGDKWYDILYHDLTTIYGNDKHYVTGFRSYEKAYNEIMFMYREYYKARSLKQPKGWRKIQWA